VKLFLGGMDINVDSQNTKAVYEKEIKASLLSVTLHSSLQESLQIKNIMKKYVNFLKQSINQ